MKMYKEMAVNGVPYVLAKSEVLLDAKSPGRATFTFQVKSPG
jgi:hypothetical protein